MKQIDVSTVPTEYTRAVNEPLRGTVKEVTYQVNNYINQERLLVTNQEIDPKAAGRETVQGEAISKPFNIYLPAGYASEDKSTRYNVLYLFHGVGGDHYEWLRGSGMSDGNYILCNIIDNLIASGEIEPVIVVFPNGRSTHSWADQSFNFSGTNMLGFYYFDYELRYDLMPFIEANYNTYANIKDTSPAGIQANRTHRAAAGLSMGGMQALNLVLGGYRHDAIAYIEAGYEGESRLEATVPAPGMLDLFSRVGAFSNAPTSSNGATLGASIQSSGHNLDLLYMTCGDADDISISRYEQSIEGLHDAAQSALGAFYQIVMKDGVHDFKVWNNGAYNFLRAAFQPHADQQPIPNVVKQTLY